MIFVYENVNECGEIYQRTEDQDKALETLAEFPNDTVVIRVYF